MRELGLPVDAVILEDENKEEWLKGWYYREGERQSLSQPPLIWRLAL
jgi:hypothetical protein